MDTILGPQPNNTSVSRDKEVFYSDPSVINAYKAYIITVLSRNNSISGIAYKNDPAIFAWELVNEPQTTFGWERCAKLLRLSKSCVAQGNLAWHVPGLHAGDGVNMSACKRSY